MGESSRSLGGCGVDGRNSPHQNPKSHFGRPACTETRDPDNLRVLQAPILFRRESSTTLYQHQLRTASTPHLLTDDTLSTISPILPFSQNLSISFRLISLCPLLHCPSLLPVYYSSVDRGLTPSRLASQRGSTSFHRLHLSDFTSATYCLGLALCSATIRHLHQHSGPSSEKLQTHPHEAVPSTPFPRISFVRDLVAISVFTRSITPSKSLAHSFGIRVHLHEIKHSSPESHLRHDYRPLSGSRTQRPLTTNPRASSSSIHLCLYTLPLRNLPPWPLSQQTDLQSLPARALSSGFGLSGQAHVGEQHFQFQQPSLQALVEGSMQEGGELRIFTRVQLAEDARV